MSITFAATAPRSAGDVPVLYTEAQVKGLGVSHYPSLPCRVFSAQSEGDVLGVMRTVGALIFYKDERRWEVRARTDATAVDLATLLQTGLNVIAKHGRQPGHWTRRRYFRHEVSARTGKRIAWARICYQLSSEDLLGTAAVSVDVDDLVTRVLESAEPLR